MKLVVLCAMLLSWGYYCLLLAVSFGGQLLGVHNDLWDMFDLPMSSAQPPIWIVLMGLLIGCFMLASLALAYSAVWRVLADGQSQDFRRLGRRLRQLAWGLIGFWLGWNLMTGAVLALLINALPTGTDSEFLWDPFDLDIVFPILAMAILAISQMMERAWAAEDENQHFL